MKGLGVVKPRKKATLATIRPNILKLSKTLDLRWPGNEKRAELQWLQNNYDFIEQFQEKLFEAYRKAKEDAEPKNGRLKIQTKQTRKYRLLWTLWSSWPGTLQLTRQYANFINETWAWNNPRWSGNLSRFTLNEKNNKWLLQICSLIVSNYTGSGQDFYDVLLPLIKKGGK